MVSRQSRTKTTDKFRRSWTVRLVLFARARLHENTAREDEAYIVNLAGATIPKSNDKVSNSFFWPWIIMTKGEANKCREPRA